MGAKTHRDLDAWKLADELRRMIIEVVRREHVQRDFAYCRQADTAAGSACRNLAEGFARYRHLDFARFVTISHASLAELLDLLDEGLTKGYLDPAEHDALTARTERAMRAANGLRRYLHNTPTPKEHLRHGPRTRRT